MGTTLNVAVVMDDIATIAVKKDSTLAMMFEAQRRGYQLFMLNSNDLFIEQGKALAFVKPVRVFDDENHWFKAQASEIKALGEMDIILMRKDPPFDMNYIYATYLLELAQKQGALVVNSPRALRDFNEKLAIVNFPQCIPETLVSANIENIKAFIKQQNKVVVKPLDGMGGSGIFLLSADDVNQSAILTHLTNQQKTPLMAQRFLTQVSCGDKRILLIDGKPVPYGLARIPPQGAFVANLAAGGRGEGMPLTKRDRWLCEQVAPVLQQNGLLFVGIDVIGDYITEINVTSPTCIRELDKQYQLNIAADLFNAVVAKL